MRTFVLTFSFLVLAATAARAAEPTAPPPAATAPTDGTASPAAANTGAPAAATDAPASSAPATAATVGASAGLAPVLRGPSVWAILPWGGFGAGARFMLPLGIGPLLGGTNLRDSFAVEFGADFMRWSYDYGFIGGGYSYTWTQILPVAGIMWNVWLNERFALYPKIELGYAYGWLSGWDNTYAQPSYGGFFWNTTAGALYKLASNVTLRAEIGYAGLKIGAGWLF